ALLRRECASCATEDLSRWRRLLQSYLGSTALVPWRILSPRNRRATRRYRMPPRQGHRRRLILAILKSARREHQYLPRRHRFVPRRDRKSWHIQTPRVHALVRACFHRGCLAALHCRGLIGLLGAREVDGIPRGLYPSARPIA